MEYRNLGRSGVKVSAACLGTMTFGAAADEDASRRIIDSALDAGINFIDTADVYVRGTSEEIVGRAIQGKRDRIILATKVRGTMGEGPNDVGLSRAHILDGVDASLRRLNTDYIDLYQLHRPDADTPIEETLRALDDLVRAGKVRYIGCSNFAAWELIEALWVSDVNHFASFVSVQPPYSLLNRAIERELLPACEAKGVGVMVYSPLAGGILTGKYKAGEPPPPNTRYSNNPMAAQRLTDRNLQTTERLGQVANKLGVSISQLALAWLNHQESVTCAILGARSVEQFQENLGAYDVQLDEETLNQLNEIAPAR